MFLVVPNRGSTTCADAKNGPLFRSTKIREKTEEINSLTIELTKARNTEALKATRAGSETRGVTETVCGSGAPPAKVGMRFCCFCSFA